METSKIAVSVQLQGKSGCCDFPQGRHSEFHSAGDLPLGFSPSLAPTG